MLHVESTYNQEWPVPPSNFMYSTSQSNDRNRRDLGTFDKISEFRSLSGRGLVVRGKCGVWIGRGGRSPEDFFRLSEIVAQH
jgi:hypothetical protein